MKRRTVPAAPVPDAATEPVWTTPDDWRAGPGESDTRAYVNFLRARRQWRATTTERTTR